MRTKTPESRIKRDERAFRRLVAGETTTRVAADAGISTVQLWRRVGKRVQAFRAASERVGALACAG